MINKAGTVRETKALAKKFVRYKEGAELYSMGHSKFEKLAYFFHLALHCLQIIICLNKFTINVRF